jgi:hypothetical protein
LKYEAIRLAMAGPFWYKVALVSEGTRQNPSATSQNSQRALLRTQKSE